MCRECGFDAKESFAANLQCKDVVTVEPRSGLSRTENGDFGARPKRQERLSCRFRLNTLKIRNARGQSAVREFQINRCLWRMLELWFCCQLEAILSKLRGDLNWKQAVQYEEPEEPYQAGRE